VAVNPDPRLAAAAALRRWPVRYLDAPEGVPRVLGVEPFDVVRRLTARPEVHPYARFVISGTEHIPRRGPAIIVANHRSYFDPAALAIALARAGRNGRFLAKREVTDAPVLGTLVRSFGTIRVDRGTGSSTPLEAAAAALAGGEVVVILPQGTIPRGEAFFDPVLVGRPGAARLAADLPDVPVIPIGLWGTERVWPRSAKVPNVLNVTNPPTVEIRVGRPLDGLARSISAASLRRDTGRIMSSIMDLLPSESRQLREVSEAELRATMPDGRAPDAAAAPVPSDGPAPDRTTRKRAAPGKAVSKRAAPGKAVSKRAAPGKAVSKRAARKPSA
jgi:putative phosphoserine phosphatase/1-acylglycerol-3-phosphate O-acyltransferase